MRRHKYSAALGLLILSLCAFAKDKKKVPLPEDILHAHTALVIVDPTAGVDAADPNANRLARTEVEQALMKWGRLMPVNEGFTADIIIMVRKGNGKVVQPTIGGTPVNGTPPFSVGSTSTPDESTTHAAGRWGHSGVENDPSNAGTQPATSSTPDRGWPHAGYVCGLSRRHQRRSVLVAARCSGGLALYREERTRFAFRSRRRSVSQSHCGLREAARRQSLEHCQPGVHPQKLSRVSSKNTL